MCGILAASGKINPHYLAALGCLNASRGRDSAGIAWLGEDNLPKGQKVVGNPILAYSLHLAEGLKLAANSGVTIGHTRAATQGAVTVENAHPFLMEGIPFAHNGIIHNDEEFGQYAVDSQSLIHGIKAKNFSKYQGPIALVWIEDGKLHAYRHGNPLFRALKDGAMYLASEESFLKDIGCEKPTELADSYIYIIANGEIIKNYKVPENKLYVSTVSTYQRYEGGCLIEHNIKNDPKPKRKEKCTFCNHKGKVHNKIGSTGKWVCWADEKTGRISERRAGFATGSTCGCNEFISSKKVIKKPSEVVIDGKGLIVNPQLAPFGIICKCEHTIRAHFKHGDGLICRAPDCECTCFELPKENPAPAPDLLHHSEWADLGIETLCDCRHEFEYHDKKGMNKCNVMACGCEMFFPLEEESLIPPHSGMTVMD